MKLRILSLAVVILMINTIGFGKIRRVGYTGIAIANTDYSNFQLAHDACSTGDTIMLYPGSWSVNLNKRIVVLGPGYFVTGTGSNPNLQYITGGVAATINLYTGCDSSIYEGIAGMYLRVNSNETANKIIVRRCQGGIRFNNMNNSNWQVSQCYIDNHIAYETTDTVNNLTVSNCYISGFYFQNGGVAQSGQFTNNTINDAYFGDGSFFLKNNIFLYNHYNDLNCVYQNCMGNASNPLTLMNSTFNVSDGIMKYSVFVGYYDNPGGYSNDGRWALKASSPALGTGASGTDIGMYGGSNPYKLSGIPRIPTFYKLTAPSNITSTNPYTITFSVRSNN